MIYVVTNPENGWDCVVGVYEADSKEIVEQYLIDWRLASSLEDARENMVITETSFKRLDYMKQADYMEVADRLYQYVNPTSTMETPNSVYITTEKWYHEWMKTNTDLDLFNWCLKNKQ